MKFVMFQIKQKCTNQEILVTEDPKEYVICTKENRKEIFNCKNDEYFNTILKTCAITPGRGQAVHRHMTKICKNDKEILIADRDRANIYHVCGRGKEFVARCPRGKHFDEKIKLCFSKARTKSRGAKNSFCENSDKATITNDPREYILCVNGAEQGQYCNEDEYFDTDLQTCSKVPLSGRALFRHTSKICRNKQDDILPDSNLKMHVYHVCGTGKDYAATCPPGSFFDINTKNCLSSRRTKTTITQDESSGAIKAPPCKWSGIFEIPSTKKYYYKCVKGKFPSFSQEILKCQQNYIFHLLSGKCIHKNNFYARYHTVPAKSCLQYFFCVPLKSKSNTCQLRDCKEGRAYDKETKHCVPKSHINCNDEKYYDILHFEVDENDNVNDDNSEFSEIIQSDSESSEQMKTNSVNNNEISMRMGGNSPHYQNIDGRYLVENDSNNNTQIKLEFLVDINNLNLNGNQCPTLNKNFSSSKRIITEDKSAPPQTIRTIISSNDTANGMEIVVEEREVIQTEYVLASTEESLNGEQLVIESIKNVVNELKDSKGNYIPEENNIGCLEKTDDEELYHVQDNGAVECWCKYKADIVSSTSSKSTNIDLAGKKRDSHDPKDKQTISDNKQRTTIEIPAVSTTTKKKYTDTSQPVELKENVTNKIDGKSRMDPGNKSNQKKTSSKPTDVTLDYKEYLGITSSEMEELLTDIYNDSAEHLKDKNGSKPLTESKTNQKRIQGSPVSSKADRKITPSIPIDMTRYITNSKRNKILPEEKTAKPTNDIAKDGKTTTPKDPVDQHDEDTQASNKVYFVATEQYDKHNLNVESSTILQGKRIQMKAPAETTPQILHYDEKTMVIPSIESTIIVTETNIPDPNTQVPSHVAPNSEKTSNSNSEESGSISSESKTSGETVNENTSSTENPLSLEPSESNKRIAATNSKPKDEANNKKSDYMVSSGSNVEEISVSTLNSNALPVSNKVTEPSITTEKIDATGVNLVPIGIDTNPRYRTTIFESNPNNKLSATVETTTNLDLTYLDDEVTSSTIKPNYNNELSSNDIISPFSRLEETSVPSLHLEPINLMGISPSTMEHNADGIRTEITELFFTGKFVNRILISTSTDSDILIPGDNGKRALPKGNKITNIEHTTKIESNSDLSSELLPSEYSDDKNHDSKKSKMNQMTTSASLTSPVVLEQINFKGGTSSELESQNDSKDETSTSISDISNYEHNVISPPTLKPNEVEHDIGPDHTISSENSDDSIDESNESESIEMITEPSDKQELNAIPPDLKSNYIDEGSTTESEKQSYEDSSAGKRNDLKINKENSETSSYPESNGITDSQDLEVTTVEQVISMMVTSPQNNDESTNILSPIGVESDMESESSNSKPVEDKLSASSFYEKTEPSYINLVNIATEYFESINKDTASIDSKEGSVKIETVTETSSMEENKDNERSSSKEGILHASQRSEDRTTINLMPIGIENDLESNTLSTIDSTTPILGMC